MIEVKKNELEHILLTSFRYCLGRKTGIAQTCSVQLAKYWNDITPIFQEQIQRDIRKAIDRNEAGSKNDLDDWKSILKLE